MSRKDYEALARAFKSAVTDSADGPSDGGWLAYTAALVADVLAGDNPRFDRARFLRACGLQ